MAENGAQGLKVYEQEENAIGAVVTGINMPQMNGIEFVQYLRDKDPTLPILVMSGDTESLTRFAHSPLAQSELVRTIKKPFLLRELLEILSGLLVKRKEI